MFNKIVFQILLAVAFFNCICISVVIAQTEDRNIKERKVLFVKTKPDDPTQSSRLSTVKNPIVLGTKPDNDSTQANVNARQKAKPAFIRLK